MMGSLYGTEILPPERFRYWQINTKLIERLCESVVALIELITNRSMRCETHVSTKQAGSQAPPWLPRPSGHQERP